MYVTIAGAAEYLELTEKEVRHLVFQGKIRTVDDGEQILINTAQFDSYLKEVEQYRTLIQEYLSEPIPESLDVNDED